MEITQKYEEQFLREFKVLLAKEWGKVDSFDENEYGSNLPRPILAISGGNLLGGLSFTWYPNPEVSGIALWINSVFVIEEQRNLGIGTRLIARATEVAQTNELFVLTGVPSLYEKVGWQFVSAEKSGQILKYMESATGRP